MNGPAEALVPIEAVAEWLERLAFVKQRDARGGLGQIFADTEAETLRQAARVLREHPEVICARAAD